MQERLSEAQLQQYDRQRFLGLEVQKKLVQSRVLLHPVDAVICELAKNLVLTGINLALFHDSTSTTATVAPSDIADNFLFSSPDLGLPKLQTAQHHL